MRLSKRIFALCEAVNKGETVADIGTDHGYVPMLLREKGISPSVIMSDISAASLSKAKDTFKIANIAIGDDAFRVGDGLDTVSYGEVDTVIIAGLGGNTIAAIIDADIDKSRSFKRFILQPRKHSGTLRAYLFEKGFDIEREILTAEGKFICEIIVAKPTNAMRRELPYEIRDIRWAYPESFAFVDSAMLDKRLDWKIGSIDDEINNLKTSKLDRDALINELKSDREYLINLQERNHKHNVNIPLRRSRQSGKVRATIPD